MYCATYTYDRIFMFIGDLMPISEERYTRLVKINPKFIGASTGLCIGVEFLCRLLSSNAISDTDYEDINTQKANYKRCDLLMDAIMRRSNRAFDLFRQTLIDTKQEHFAMFLDEGEAFCFYLFALRLFYVFVYFFFNELFLCQISAQFFVLSFKLSIV